MKKWWHDKIVYQIYPKSFFDSNGDGIGDIQGIIQKLDYIKSLGADILWICPMYPSPMADQGYDISDYYNIDPTFGTLDDMDRLISESKKRGMYVIMDLVVNHCSDEHEWFRKACQEPGGKYGKYFYIEDIKDGKSGNRSRDIRTNNISTSSTKNSLTSTGKIRRCAKRSIKLSISGWTMV